MGGIRNVGVIEEDMHQDLRPGMAAMLGLNHMVLEWRGGSLDCKA